MGLALQDSSLGEAMDALVQSIKDYLKDAFTIDISFVGGSPTAAAGGGSTIDRYSGHAKGGVVDRPQLSMIGENSNREYVIPTEGPNAKRGMALWQAAGKELGMFGASPAMAMTPGDSKPLLSGKLPDLDWRALWSSIYDSTNAALWSAVIARTFFKNALPTSMTSDKTMLGIGGVAGIANFLMTDEKEKPQKQKKKISPSSDSSFIFNINVSVGQEAQVGDTEEALALMCQEIMENIRSQQDRLNFA